MVKERIMGYVIAEAAVTEPAKPQVISEENGRPVTEACLQDLEVKNRNGRWYSRDIFIPELQSKRIVELIKARSLFGEAGHPLNKELSRQQVIDPNNRACRYNKIWMDGNDVMAHVQAAPTACGDDFNRCVLDGVEMAYSLRALGSIVSTKRGNEVKNLKIITWDNVIFPSHARAYQRSILTENAMSTDPSTESYIIPVTDTNVIKHIQESSNNLKEIVENYEIFYDQIVVENYNRVKLTTTEGDIVVVNLESFIRDEIMDYASNKFNS